MATRTIYVSLRPNTTQLKVRDSEGHDPGNDNITTVVTPGDTIVWELDNNSNLASLNGISKKAQGYPNDTNLLVSPPASDNGVYTGTVVASPPQHGTYIEHYQIDYQITPGGPVLNDDPILQMNV